MNEMDKRPDIAETVATWESLNLDWMELGDITDRLARSEWDSCPGCGSVDNLSVLNVGQDDPYVIVICSPCQWQAGAETPTEAIDNWNNRYQNATLDEAIEVVKFKETK